jgi:hypothetical protein
MQLFLFGSKYSQQIDERERRAALEATQQFVCALLAPFAADGRVPAQARDAAESQEVGIQESHLIH